MAPSRPENKKAKLDVAKLLVNAQTQLEVGNLHEASEIAQQALDATGAGGDFELSALNLLGTIHVEAGDIDDARAYFLRAATLDPEGAVDEKVGGGPEKFLLLAQLSEEGGQDSVGWFERGVVALRKQIQALSGLPSKTAEQQAALDEKQQKLGGVLCAVAEVYMTDLSWEADAEARCEALVTEAMLIAPQSAETWQTVANVRISQERQDEARAALSRSLELWQDLPANHPAVPEFPTRIALARLLLETAMEEEALRVLERLVADDDTSVEAWYLGGWCLYISGDKTASAASAEGQNGASAVPEDTKAAWKTSRQWLTQCLRLYQLQDYEDERLGEHAQELLASINEAVGALMEGEEEEWEDAASDDEDAEMQG